MRRRLYWKKSIFFLIILFFLLFVFHISKLIYAQEGGLIHACVKTNNGSLRILGASDTCKSNETPLDWNIQGSPGTSTVYQASFDAIRDNHGNYLHFDGFPNNIISINNLSAGNYLVQVALVDGESSGTCALNIDDLGPNPSHAPWLSPLNSNTLFFTDSIRLTSQGNISLYCGEGFANIYKVTLTAIPVDNLILSTH